MSSSLILLCKIYLPVQLILLPLILMYKQYRNKYDNYNTQWILHRILLILVLVAPLFVFINPKVIVTSKPQNIIKEEHNNKTLTTSINTNNIKSIPFVINKNITDREADKTSFRINFVVISLIILSIGIINCLFSLVKEKRIISIINKNGKLNHYKKITVITSYLVSAPFSHGLFKSKIYLPENLEERYKNIVLTHELNHIKSNHLFWLIIEVFCKKIFWFNPLFYILNKEGELLREIICDIQTIKNIDKLEYSKALVNAVIGNYISPNLSCVSWGNQSSLNIRIKKLLSKGVKMPNKLSKIKSITISAIILTLLLLFPGNIFSEEDKKDTKEYLNTVPESQFKDFLKSSEKEGAFIASQDFDMREVMLSLTKSERENIPWASPVKTYRRTLSFGRHEDPFTGKYFFHRGNDMAYSLNTPIYAPGNGEVILTSYLPESYGKIIIIKHDYKFYTLYAHLNSIEVKKGDKIKKGEIIAKMGSTGKSTGPHLHYEVHQGVNPASEIINNINNNKPISEELPELILSLLNSFYFIPEEEYDSPNYTLILNNEKYGIKEEFLHN